MPNRAVTIGGLAVAGGVGYYLYQAGGDPKVAQKQAEADASRLSSDVKSHLPGSGKEAKKEAELSGEKLGQQADRAWASTKAQVSKADSKIDQYRADAEKKLEQARKDTGSTLSSAVDKFDKNVQDGAAKTQSWIGSWFGSGKK